MPDQAPEPKRTGVLQNLGPDGSRTVAIYARADAVAITVAHPRSSFAKVNAGSWISATHAREMHGLLLKNCLGLGARIATFSDPSHDAVVFKGNPHRLLLAMRGRNGARVKIDFQGARETTEDGCFYLFPGGDDTLDQFRVALEFAIHKAQEMAPQAKANAPARPQVKKASWNSIVLPDAVQRVLVRTSKAWQHHDTLAAQGVDIPRYILLHGPPGTGKTEIARVLANEAGLSVVIKSSADMVGAYTGQTLLKVKEVFAEARAAAPCILFLDELDGLTSSRSHTQGEAITQLLQELDGVIAHPEFVAVVAATNVLDKIDPAIRSRFATQIEIALPDAFGRARIILALLSSKPFEGDAVPLAGRIGALTDGRSGRDLKALVSHAEGLAVDRALSAGDVANVRITPADFGPEFADEPDFEEPDFDEPAEWNEK